MTLFKGSCHVKLIIDSLSLSILFSPYSNSFPLNSRLGAAKSKIFWTREETVFLIPCFFWCARHPERVSTGSFFRAQKHKNTPFPPPKWYLFLFWCARSQGALHIKKKHSSKNTVSSRIQKILDFATPSLEFSESLHADLCWKSRGPLKFVFWYIDSITSWWIPFQNMPPGQPMAGHITAGLCPTLQWKGARAIWDSPDSRTVGRGG